MLLLARFAAWGAEPSSCMLRSGLGSSAFSETGFCWKRSGVFSRWLALKSFVVVHGLGFTVF